MPAKINSDASSSRKMLELYILLVFSGRKFTLTKLAERLQCSKATILRLMTDVELVEIIETGKDGRERWFRINKLANKQSKVFTHESIQQLVLCKDILFSLLPEDFRIELEQSVEGVANFILDKEVKEYALTPVARSCVKGVIDYTPFQSIIAKIMQAIPKKRICNVVYKSLKSQEDRSFTVAPMRIMAYHESLYVECWRIKEQDGKEIIQPMTLAIQRIKSFEPMPRKNHKLTEYPNCDNFSFGMIKKSLIRVKVRFDHSVKQYLVERKWSEDQVFADLEDGRLELSFSVGDKDEFFSWLLGFGYQAELVEPLDLRHEFFHKLNMLRDVYLGAS